MEAISKLGFVKLQKNNLFWILLLFVFYFISSPVIADIRGLEWKGPRQKISTPFLQGNYRAIVIGNNVYKDKSGTWKHLKTAVKDAESVAHVLKEKYGFEVSLLKNVGRREILVALNDLSRRVDPNDNVLIYYAGHGHLDEETNRGYWIPVDAIGKDNTTFIRNSTIRDEISIIAEKTKHTLLISDSCFSGSLLRGGNRAIKETEKTNPYYVKVSNKKSVQILAAGGVEYVDDNYKGSGHSPFTYFLLNELNNNLESLLTMSELATNVIKAVANNVEQTPEAGVLQGAGDELGEFIFARITVKDNIVEIFTGKVNPPKRKEIPTPATEAVPAKKESFAPLPRF